MIGQEETSKIVPESTIFDFSLKLGFSDINDSIYAEEHFALK